MNRLYANGKILLPDHSLVEGSVGTRGRDIVHVGATPDGDMAWDETVDLNGGVLMPGLVNAHGHSAMTLLRGLGAGLPLKRWLEEAIFPVEANLTHEDVKAGMTWPRKSWLNWGDKRRTMCRNERARALATPSTKGG